MAGVVGRLGVVGIEWEDGVVGRKGGDGGGRLDVDELLGGEAELVVQLVVGVVAVVLRATEEEVLRLVRSVKGRRGGGGLRGGGGVGERAGRTERAVGVRDGEREGRGSILLASSVRECGEWSLSSDWMACRWRECRPSLSATLLSRCLPYSTS